MVVETQLFKSMFLKWGWFWPQGGGHLAVPRVFFGEGNGTPLQYSRLENPIGGGAW